MREKYYINSRGDRINLDRWPYRIKNINLQGWEWDYDAANMGNVGGKIQRIFRNVKEFEVTVTVCTQSGGPQQRLIDLKNLYEGLEYDAAVGAVGKFYIGQEYMQCIFTESHKTTNKDIPNALDVKYTVVSPYPMWCHEEEVDFYEYQSQINENGLNYPYNYPYNYTADLAQNYLENTNYRANDFKMTIFGPINNPSILIGSTTYTIDAEISTGEYAVINSRDKEAYKVGNNGVITNLFNSRSRDQSIFTKIPSGKNQVIYSGAFAFSVTLFHERSEPDCTLY